MIYPRIVETPNSLEPSIAFWPAECCRIWEVAMHYPVGRCGLCGRTPRLLTTEEAKGLAS